MVERRRGFCFFPPLTVTLTASQQAARSFPRSAGWQLAFFHVDTHAPGFPRPDLSALSHIDGCRRFVG